ncbi:hypothetical protein Q5692_30930 [Microcoleus sp. C2C3]|uniref:hypothetical protein n=1 Tax=unclassified Microcoleus TaxID=2642155 RepID=UPI002FD1FF25
MFHQNSCYKKKANLQIRQIAETDTCLIFAPDNTTLYSLDISAWLIFELCDGKSREEIEKTFLESVVPTLTDEKARSYFNEGLNSLLEEKIVELVA